MYNQAEMARYPWWLLTRLASHVEHHQPTEAHEDLERLLERFNREHDGFLTPRKLRCAAVMSQCLRSAHRGGAASDVILGDFMSGLDELSRKRSWNGICTFMRKYIDSLLAHVQTLQSRNVDRLIGSIRQQLLTAPDHVRSLKDYARDAGVNAEYLSRRFTEFTGLRFRDERKKAQVDLAKILLEQTTLKTRVIARRVGLNDFSRFTRYFREFTGVTPARYRRQHRIPIEGDK